MDLAIVLAALAGSAWAVNIVVVRWALGRTEAPALVSATVAVTVACLITLVVALVSGGSVPAGGDVWRFAVVGAIAPGSSQGLFVASIGIIGSSRTSVLIGTSPAWSVMLAIFFLDESWQLAIIAGTALTVVGSALISWESGGRAKRLGVMLALATALSFAVRDVTARKFNAESDVSAWWEGAIVLGAASIVLWGLSLGLRRGAIGAGVRAALPEFLGSGLMIGLALPTLLEALDRGRVGLVAPLSLAVQNLTAVALGAVFFGAHERSTRVLVALVAIVAGATLVGTA